MTCVNLRSLAGKAGAEVLSLLLNVTQQRAAPIAVDTHPRKTRRTRPRINVPSGRQHRDIGRNWLSCVEAHSASGVLVIRTTEIPFTAQVNLNWVF